MSWVLICIFCWSARVLANLSHPLPCLVSCVGDVWDSRMLGTDPFLLFNTSVLFSNSLIKPWGGKKGEQKNKIASFRILANDKGKFRIHCREEEQGLWYQRTAQTEHFILGIQELSTPTDYHLWRAFSMPGSAPGALRGVISFCFHNNPTRPGEERLSHMLKFRHIKGYYPNRAGPPTCVWLFPHHWSGAVDGAYFPSCVLIL